MSNPFELVQPLALSTFGGTLRLAGQPGAEALVLAAEANPAALPHALGQCHGLLCLPGMEAMADDPDLLLRLSRIFGPEVEDYQNTGMAKNMIHPTVSEIFVVSNIPPVRILEGHATLETVGAEIVGLIQAVAGRLRTKSEAMGHQEFILTYKSFQPIGPACLPVA